MCLIEHDNTQPQHKDKIWCRYVSSFEPNPSFEILSMRMLVSKTLKRNELQRCNLIYFYQNCRHLLNFGTNSSANVGSSVFCMCVCEYDDSKMKQATDMKFVYGLNIKIVDLNPILGQKLYLMNRKRCFT